jgi:hypothetical protein
VIITGGLDIDNSTGTCGWPLEELTAKFRHSHLEAP